MYHGLNLSGCLDMFIYFSKYFLYLELIFSSWHESLAYVQEMLLVTLAECEGILIYFQEILFLPWAESLFSCISSCVKGGGHSHLMMRIIFFRMPGWSFHHLGISWLIDFTTECQDDNFIDHNYDVDMTMMELAYLRAHKK